MGRSAKRYKNDNINRKKLFFNKSKKAKKINYFYGYFNNNIIYTYFSKNNYVQ